MDMLRLQRDARGRVNAEPRRGHARPPATDRSLVRASIELSRVARVRAVRAVDRLGRAGAIAQGVTDLRAFRRAPLRRDRPPVRWLTQV